MVSIIFKEFTAKHVKYVRILSHFFHWIKEARILDWENEVNFFFGFEERFIGNTQFVSNLCPKLQLPVRNIVGCRGGD
jgi:hypothetical protein